MSNPNPQAVEFSSYEAVTLTVTMTTNGSISGQTFQLNVRDLAGNIKYQITPATIVNNGSSSTPGVFTLSLTSTQTGALLGEYRYDIWRTDSGSEKRLAWGNLTIRPEQWK